VTLNTLKNASITSKKNSFQVLLLITLIMMSNNLIHPATPEMLMTKNISTEYYGVLFASMSLGMFLSSPF